MKIKYISLFMAALLSVSAFTACGSDSTDNSDDSSETVIASAEGYDVVSVNLENEVYYAQIKGLSDETVQSEINDMLEDLEKSRHAPTKSYTAKPVVSYCGDDYLSIQQNAEFNKGGSSSTIINLDMKTGEEFELGDIADLNEMAEKIYTDNSVTVLSGYEGASIQTYLEESHKESAEDILRDLDSCHFYLDENKNIIITLCSSSGFMDVLVK